MDSMDELRSPSLPTSPAAPIIVFPSPSMLSVLQLLGTIRCPEKPRAAQAFISSQMASGTETDAVNGLPLPEADRARFVAHIAVADAVCYIFGYAGVIIFCTVVAPALLRI